MGGGKWVVGCDRLRHTQHSLVFVREDLNELRNHFSPVFENPLAARAGGRLHVLFDQILNGPQIDRVFQRLQIHAGPVAEHVRELSRLIQNVRDATGHPRGKVATSAA